MKIYVVNGGPRKTGNTMQLAEHLIRGIESVAEASIEVIHLYDLEFKGCRSCFACQRDNDATYGWCQYRDDIWEYLRKIPLADGVVFASPIYIHSTSAVLRAFLERLLYQFIDFSGKGITNAPKKLQVAMVYSMNLPENALGDYLPILEDTEHFISRTFQTKPLRVCACNTYQYSDYSLYRVGRWNPVEKEAYRKKQFPLDCQAAYETGRNMALAILEGELKGIKV